MKNLGDLRIKIFADGAQKEEMLELYRNPLIRGFTTNPTLMHKAGIADYKRFVRETLFSITDKPISFEVFADEFEEMERQARLIASFGPNVYVKIPITNTKGESSFDLVRRLAAAGIKLNITAVLTLEQVRHIVMAFPLHAPGVISVFAGRIADAGIDPLPLMRQCQEIIKAARPQLELLWASPRELLNIFQAEAAGCDIITLIPDILKKINKIGSDLSQLSLETVKMFYEDGQKAGYKLEENLSDYRRYINTYLEETKEIVQKIDRGVIEKMMAVLEQVRKQKGRLFILGVGGSAANASHAVNDFRKICNLEAYAPTDNVAELTARTNDEGFESTFKKWLETSQLKNTDAVLVFSVSGGNQTTSRNIVLALEYAKQLKVPILGVVGRDGGATRSLADVTLLIPVIEAERITPHVEEWQGIIWHLIVNGLISQPGPPLNVLKMLSQNQGCRHCGSTQLVKFLSLGEQPLANRFLMKEELSQPEHRFPLEVYFCENCHLVQLIDVVDKEILFRNYIYFSSGMPKLSDHFQRYAEDIKNRFLKPSSLVVEIASNDGLLLKYFKDYGHPVLGIEPAVNIVTMARSLGVPTLNDFFSEKLAEKIAEDYGRAEAVLATNVIAHINDYWDLGRGIKRLLADDGVFAMEVIYLVDMFERLAYDSIYHEHLSYLAVTPLKKYFEKFNLEIFDVEIHPVQGQALRLFVSRKGKRPISINVSRAIEKEKVLGLDRIDSYFALAERIAQSKNKLVARLKELKNKGKKIATYGASARGNTLLNYCQIGTDVLDYALEDLPSKQGLYTPGMHIPVVDRAYGKAHEPDYYLLLAWNYLKPILAKEQSFISRGGKFIIPIGDEIQEISKE